MLFCIMLGCRAAKYSGALRESGQAAVMPESMPAKETNACVQVACENGGAFEEHDGSPAGSIPCCMFPRSCGDGALDEGRMFAVFSDEARASFLSARGRLQVSRRHPEPLEPGTRDLKPHTGFFLSARGRVHARASADGADIPIPKHPKREIS